MTTDIRRSMARHEGEKLVSRSQAKRLTMRFERFQTVVLDFDGVEEIGQAFADEVFRVFQQAHLATALLPIHMTQAVENMGASKNPNFVAMPRCSQKIIPYISNICCVAIFCSRLA